jgi:hypothetical protein
MKIIPKSAWLAATIAALVYAGPAFADTIHSVTGTNGSGSVSGNEEIGGQSLNGVNYLTFNSLTSGTNYSAGVSVATGVELYVSGNSAYVTDASNNPFDSSEPYLSGSDWVNFYGSMTEGQSGSSNWLATGAGGGTGEVLLSFSSPEDYFGLLWGSIDDGNSLEFYSGPVVSGAPTGTLIATVTGSELLADDSNIVDHATVADGTAYVNLYTSLPFESVEETSSFTTYETTDYAYGDIVPDGGSTVAFLGLALFGLGILNRKLLS